MRDSDDERPTDAHGVVSSIDDDDELEGDGETVTTLSEDHLRNGTDVGGYVVDGELGFGGMGVVYSATHPIIGKRAAIKVLKPELSDNPAAVERFMMEARAVNQIGHPNIVDIFAFGKLPDGRSYYVMDLLSGESLRRRLKRVGALHPAEAISIIDETASALMAAHDKGIVHRDLKPDNVFMVSAPGRWPEVRILDWGLLKLTSQQSAVSSSKYRTLAGSVMGTPVYMSPEQARASDAVDFRADVYSLGVMSYELLAGVVPFKKGSSIDTLLAHQDDPVPPLADKCPSLPIELVQLIEAMLAKEPDGRPTLAAVRTVIKRLRGTKIPTMTAAGLEMPEPAPPTPRLSFNSPTPGFVAPATDPATGPREPFVEPPTAPQLPSATQLGAHRDSAGRSPSVDRVPTPGSPSIVGNLSAPPSLGRTPTSPPIATPRTQTPAGGTPRPATSPGGVPRTRTAPPDSRNVATTPPGGVSRTRTAPPDSRNVATTPPPMRAQAQLDRKPTTPPGGLPLPPPPRSERMQSQPDPELASPSTNTLPYQSVNVAPSTFAGQGMPVPGTSAPIAGQGMPLQALANQGMPLQALENQGMPMPHQALANQGPPFPSGVPTPGVMPGSYGSIQSQYQAPASYPQIGRQPTGTPQTMTATSSGSMKRVLVIAIAAIVVSAIGIAIVMLA